MAQWPVQACSCAYKSSKKLKSVKGFASARRLFTKKWKLLIFWGRILTSLRAPIEVEFCTAKRTQVPVGHAKFDVNRCNESPLWGRKPDFWPVSKFNTSSLQDQDQILEHDEYYSLILIAAVSATSLNLAEQCTQLEQNWLVRNWLFK